MKTGLGTVMGKLHYFSKAGGRTANQELRQAISDRNSNIKATARKAAMKKMWKNGIPPENLEDTLGACPISGGSLSSGSAKIARRATPAVDAHRGATVYGCR